MEPRRSHSRGPSWLTVPSGLRKSDDNNRARATKCVVGARADQSNATGVSKLRYERQQMDYRGISRLETNLRIPSLETNFWKQVDWSWISAKCCRAGQFDTRLMV